MNTEEDSSFEELSYAYDNSDDYSSEEFVEEVDDMSEGSAVVVIELPISFLQLNDSDPPAEIARTEDCGTTSSRSFIDKSSALNTTPPVESSPTFASTFSETLSAVRVDGVGTALSHDVDSRRACTHESFSFGGWSSYQMSTQGSTMGTSAFADFDIISVGGSVKRLCKRCTFVGNENDCFCQSCGLAWCANPCTDLDALIAAQMQFKEEELFHDTIQKEERMRENLRDQTAPVQAQLLTNDILRFVEGYSVGSEKDELTVRTFTELQVYMLAMEFIADFISRRNSENACFSEIHLYYYVSSSEELVRIRCGDGFLHSTTLREKLEAAYQSAKTSRWLQVGDRSDEDVLYLGWIVAISHHEHVKLSTVDNDAGMVEEDGSKIGDCNDEKAVFHTYSGQAVLPLVYFDVSQHRNGADPIFNGLFQVCSDFFSHLQRIEPLPECNVRHDGVLQSVEL